MMQYKMDQDDLKVYPLGLTRVKGGIHVSVEAAAAECALLLFQHKADQKQEEKAALRIPFPEKQRIGDIWEMTLLGRGFDQYDYAFEADGKVFSDPYGASFTGHEEWGNLGEAKVLLKTPVRQKPFDWEGDMPLNLPYEDCIVYRAHVRGFTKHTSSGVPGRGTFRGIIGKIPYLKELGITTLELLPTAEFQEVMMPEHADGNPYGEPEPTGKLNYWGYCRAYAFAPKASYAGRRSDPVIEMKRLVKELHKAGIELVVEMFFTGKESPSYVLDAVRHWVREYHIDGVHFTGYAPTDLLAKDPYLAATKLWAVHWNPEDVNRKHKKHLGEYNEDYLNVIRRCLKGDDDHMKAMMGCIRNNPVGCARLNFLAGTNGFTLMDMVCYEQKHNEANGENNRDGNDYNYTWNCGEEGPTRKRRILTLRRQQLYNALAMLFLSQGTPVILAGDEFGNTQKGNNNAYCQDNDTTWLNWNLLRSNKALFDYVKALIAFRKAHPVFHQKTPLMGMDYLACGHPDISFHGARAWVPEFEAFSRQLGILYCGKYGKFADGSTDNYFYVAYNMHWEPHEFALPNLPKPLSWHAAMNTANVVLNEDGALAEGEELDNQKQLIVAPRTIQILIGKPGTLNPEKTVKKPVLRKKTEKIAEDLETAETEEMAHAENPTQKEQKILTNSSKTDINGKV